MVPSIPSILAVALALSASVVADSAATCSRDSKCPQSSPCCSQYGQCGSGAYCLGGCDPFSSFSLNSCMPAPICRSADYKLTSTDDIAPNTLYLGDAGNASWVSSGSPQKYTDSNGDQVLLTMPANSVGTLLASTSYVWYGKISAKMKTSKGKGVVTAFILLGDSKDEIDFEFVGVDLNTAQTNFYFQGIPVYTNTKNLTVDDTFDNYHTYEIDWQPDQTTWSIDGKELRTLKKSDTWNSTDNKFHYPQSPTRIQLSLWPAGDPKNAKGTIDWAGGVIDWSQTAMGNAGYYYAMVQDVSVQCYDPPSGANVTGSKSYIYTGYDGTNNTVAVTNEDTIMKSFLDSGLNPEANAPTSGAASQPTQANTVPGVDSGGVRQGSGNSGSPGNSGGSGTSSGSDNGGSGTNGGPGTMPTIAGFTQGKTSGASAVGLGDEKVLKGSMFAVLVAIGSLMVL